MADSGILRGAITIAAPRGLFVRIDGDDGQLAIAQS
jgi:hypothetical protein